MSIACRLERLEAAATPRGGGGTPLYLSVYLKELENVERLESGAEPVPFTEDEDVYRREAGRWFRDVYLPAQRARTEPGSPNRATIEALEAHAITTEGSI